MTGLATGIVFTAASIGSSTGDASGAIMTATVHGRPCHRLIAHHPTIAVTRHPIAAGHYLGATAGFAILETGGNAIVAGVAARRPRRGRTQELVRRRCPGAI